MSSEPVVYEGSDGRYYTDWQLRKRLRSETWTLCLRDRIDDRWLVEADDGELVSLRTIVPESLPPWVEVRAEIEMVYAVDTRRTVP